MNNHNTTCNARVTALNNKRSAGMTDIVHGAARTLIIVGAWALSLAMSGCGEGGSGGSSGDLLTGTGGSTARMTIVNNYLYAIAGNRIQLFDIQEPATPAPWTRVTIDWDIETLFPHGD